MSGILWGTQRSGMAADKLYSLTPCLPHGKVPPQRNGYFVLSGKTKKVGKSTKKWRFPRRVFLQDFRQNSLLLSEGQVSSTFSVAPTLTHFWGHIPLTLALFSKAHSPNPRSLSEGTFRWPWLSFWWKVSEAPTVSLKTYFTYSGAMGMVGHGVKWVIVMIYVICMICMIQRDLHVKYGWKNMHGGERG